MKVLVYSRLHLCMDTFTLQLFQKHLTNYSASKTFVIIPVFSNITLTFWTTIMVKFF